MMFTPQKKGWAGWGLPENGSATGNNGRTSLGAVLARGKAVIAPDENPPLPPPPAGLLEEKEVGVEVDGGRSEDWKRFRESGLLDEKVQLRRDKEVLLQRVSGLEIERDECLYNMGLLLIEKNEWSSQIEELKQALEDAQEILKREQTAHIIAVSELEKREESLKKALELEKQCVVDLEKALHEMRAELAESKFISENKLANAHALEASLEEKQLEIESKLRAADARLAEANRKNSEIDRKLDDLEARERKVQRDLSSLNTERKALESDLSKQQEHLQEWERELLEKQRRFLDEQRLLNEREDRINDLSMNLKEKGEEVEQARKRIDTTISTLNCQEEDLKERLRALNARVKGVEIKSSNIEKKEKDLKAIEEKLNVREREEIQRLLNEHNAALDAKKKEFELDLATKKRSFDEEVKKHFDILEKDKNLIRVKEEQLLKREKAFEIEAGELKMKGKDLDSKSKALRNWEDTLKTDEKLLQEEKKKLLKESNEVEASRAKLHKEKVAIETEGKKVIFEKETLKITQEEREQHLKLQTELKLEKAEYEMMLESLEKQKEALRQERDMFERDWETLDEHRVALEADRNKLSAETEKFEKWRRTEDERLKKQGLESRAGMQREIEDLRLKKETFEKMMDQERSLSHAEVDRERADMSREFEILKHELEMDMQRKHDDSEKQFQEMKNVFEIWREAELTRIKSLTESNDLKLRRLEMEHNQLLREKEGFSEQRQKLEADRHEVQKDIDTLLRLSNSLKDRREEFAKEKEVFFSAAEQCKTCHNCGVANNNFDVLDFQPLGGADDSEEVLLPTLTDGYLEEEHVREGSMDRSNGGPNVGLINSGSHMKQWLQRCANLFKISPRKDVNPPTEDQVETSFDDQLHRAALAALENTDYEPPPSASLENQIVNVDSEGVLTGEIDRLDNAGEDTETSFGVADSSIDIVRIHLDNGIEETAVVKADENNEMEGSTMLPKEDSQQEPLKRGLRRKPKRRTKSKPIHRTRSVKAVVEEAKAILGEDLELKADEQQSDVIKGSETIPEESQEAQVKADPEVTNKRGKRRRREAEPESSEPHSDNLSNGGRLRKRQSSSQSTAPADKRYNLRRSTVANTAASWQGTSHQKEEGNAGGHQPLPHSNNAEGGRPESNGEENSSGAERSNFHDQSSGAMENLDNFENMLHKSSVHSVVEVQSEKIVQFEFQEVNEDSVRIKSAEFMEHIAGDMDEVEGDNGNIAKSTEFIEQIVEVGPHEDDVVEQEGNAESPSDFSSESDGEDDSEDEDSEQKQTASVGKKLWNFFTT